MKGFTLLELLVTMSLTLVLALLLFSWEADVLRAVRVQPEVMDMSHRGRAGLDELSKDLLAAGAGVFGAGDAGVLARWVPPIFPHRRGVGGGDEGAAFFTNRITLLTVEEGMPRALVAGEMRTRADDVPLDARGCPIGHVTCGFELGNSALIFDRLGRFDLFEVRGGWPIVVQHEPSVFSHAYRDEDGAQVVGVKVATYYHDEERRQLRRTEGSAPSVPVLDDVVGLEFRYSGAAAVPLAPRPPPGEANCLFDALGAPALAPLVGCGGPLCELSEAMLTDGPFCGVGAARFDADLYRVRRVRVKLRVQAVSDELRGVDAWLFRMPGRSRDVRLQAPDFELELDVTPRNLQIF